MYPPLTSLFLTYFWEVMTVETFFQFTEIREVTNANIGRCKRYPYEEEGHLISPDITIAVPKRLSSTIIASSSTRSETLRRKPSLCYWRSYLDQLVWESSFFFVSTERPKKL